MVNIVETSDGSIEIDEEERSVIAAVQSLQDAIRYYEHPSFFQFFKPYSHGQKQWSIWNKAKGTTNIVVRREKEVIVGLDSRISTNKLRKDTQKKYTLITSKILATMAGNVDQCKDAWELMKKYVSENDLEENVPTCVGTLAKIASEKERSNDDGDCEIYVVGVPNGKPEIHYVMDEYDKNKKKRNRQLEEFHERFDAIGSGSVYVFSEVGNILNDPNCALDLEQTAAMVQYGLLCATLGDPSTGGPLLVLIVNSDGVKEMSKSNVIDLYVEFYYRFTEIENRSIFLFYISEINKESLSKKLGKKKVDEEGHPLIQLEGGYYIHRIVFKTNDAAKLVLNNAKKVPKSKMPPFTDWTRLKLMTFGKKKIFLARQSRDLLSSLRLASIEEVVSSPE